MEGRKGFTPNAPCLPLPLEELTNPAGARSSDAIQEGFESTSEGVKSKVRKLRKAIDKLRKRNELVEAIMLSNKLVQVTIKEIPDVVFQREVVYNHVKLISLLSNGKRRASEDLSMCVEFLQEAIPLLHDPRLERQRVDVSQMSRALQETQASPTNSGRRVIPKRFSHRWPTCRFNLQVLLHTNIALCHYQLANGIEAKQHINKAISEMQRAETLHLKVGPEVESFARLAMCSLHSQEGLHDLALSEAERAINAIESIVVPERGQASGSSANLVESLVYAYYNAGVETEHLTARKSVQPGASDWYDKALKLARRHYRLFSREMIRSFERAANSCRRAQRLPNAEHPSSAPARRSKAMHSACHKASIHVAARRKEPTQPLPKWLKRFAISVALGLEPGIDLNSLHWIEFLGELNKSAEVEQCLIIRDLARMLQQLFENWTARVPALHFRLQDLFECFAYDTSLQRYTLLKGLETFAHWHPTSYYQAEIHFKDILDAAASQESLLPQWHSASRTETTATQFASEDLHHRLRSLSKLRFDSLSVSPQPFTAHIKGTPTKARKKEVAALLHKLKQGPVPMARPLWPEAREAPPRALEHNKFVEPWPPLIRHEEMMRIVKSDPNPSQDWQDIARTLYDLASLDDSSQTSRDVRAVLSSSHLDFSSQLHTLVLTMNEKLHS